jgi:hypothetical protein
VLPKGSNSQESEYTRNMIMFIQACSKQKEKKKVQNRTIHHKHQANENTKYTLVTWQHDHNLNQMGGSRETPTQMKNDPNIQIPPLKNKRGGR